MRTLGELSTGTRHRLRRYIASWPTLSTEELARDLDLYPTTVAAVRAHLTRRVVSNFNKHLTFIGR